MMIPCVEGWTRRRFARGYQKLSTDEDKLDLVEIDGFFSLFHP